MLINFKSVKPVTEKGLIEKIPCALQGQEKKKSLEADGNRGKGE